MLLPVKGARLMASRHSETLALNSKRLWNSLLRSFPRIRREAILTEFSTAPLSLLSPIEDKRDYLQSYIIFKTDIRWLEISENTSSY
jgi:hypothetical protein